MGNQGCQNPRGMGGIYVSPPPIHLYLPQYFEYGRDLEFGEEKCSVLVLLTSLSEFGGKNWSNFGEDLLFYFYFLVFTSKWGKNCSDFGEDLFFGLHLNLGEKTVSILVKTFFWCRLKNLVKTT